MESNCGTLDEREQLMLKRVMETGFFLQDLKLYLDTHPRDAQALQLYCKTAEQYRRQHDYFSQNVYPLTADTAGGKDCWNWIEGGWPPAKS